jgi:hypothetical protein
MPDPGDPDGIGGAGGVAPKLAEELGALRLAPQTVQKDAPSVLAAPHFGQFNPERINPHLINLNLGYISSGR